MFLNVAQAYHTEWAPLQQKTINSCILLYPPANFLQKNGDDCQIFHAFFDILILDRPKKFIPWVLRIQGKSLQDKDSHLGEKGEK